MTTPTDTPLTDACPHCGDKYDSEKFFRYECGTLQQFPSGTTRTELCHQTEVSNIWMKRAERAESELEKLKAGKVFVDPKWIYDLETQLAKAHEELCQAGLREYGN